MIYTIGHTETYERGFREQGADFKKRGMTPGLYDGGSVWKHRYEAQSYLDLLGVIHNRPATEYSVYGVMAPWNHTMHVEGEPFNRLLPDAQLVRLK